MTSTWRIAALILALGQVVASVVVQVVGSAFQTPDRPGEPLIVPVGWAFSIWSVVILLAVVYAVWAVGPRRPDQDLRDRLAVPLTVTFAGFSVWLVAAQVEPVWTTLAVFVVMLAALLYALRIAVDARDRIARWDVVGRASLWGLLGVYTGWSTVAIWVNLTTALAYSGAPVTGTAGVLGQLAVLAGATATALLVVRASRGLLPYAAAVVWGLGTSALGSSAAGEPVLAGTALVAAVLVVVAVVAVRRGWATGASPRDGRAVGAV